MWLSGLAPDTQDLSGSTLSGPRFLFHDRQLSDISAF